MQVLEQIVLGNTLQRWGTALLTAATVLAALWIVVHVVLRHLAAFARRTETDIDNLIAYVGAQTKLGLLASPALYVGSHALTLPAVASTWLRTIAWAASLVQVAVWGDALLDFWLQDYREAQGQKDAERFTTFGALTFLLRLILYGLIALLVLDNIPGVELTALIGSLGVGGIAVALAVQSILGDLFASLSIAMDRPFVVGDFIDVGVESGTVEHIGLKTTRIRSLSGEELILGNNDILSARIHNYGRMAGERRVVFSVGVSPETPYEKLQNIPSIISEIVHAQPKVRFGRASLSKLGSSSLDHEVVYFIQDPNFDLYMQTQHAINLGILQRFAQEGIQIPYPTQTVYVTQRASAAPSEQPRPREST